MMKWVLCIVGGLILLGSPRFVINAQSSNLTTVQCGDVIEGEFTELPEKETYYHYLIQLEEGTKLTVRGEVV